jgi:hypothetical protein
MGALPDSPRMEFDRLRVYVHAPGGPFNPPVGPEAGEVRHRQWTEQALGWNGILARWQSTNRNFWTLSGCWRRKDRAGTGTLPLQSGSSSPADVLISFPVDPEPSMAGEFAYTSFDEATSTFRVRIRRSLGDPAQPPPYNTQEFFMETVWHELGHVVCGLLMESFGEAYVRSKIQAIFGGGAWNTGRWENRALEGFCETFKDWMFSGRQYNNRTNRKMPTRAWEAFGDLVCQATYMPGGRGPLSREMGADRTDLVQCYSAPVDGWPTPAPEFDWGQNKPRPYDFPIKAGNSFNQFRGFVWMWGGRGGGSANLSSLRPLVLVGEPPDYIDEDRYLQPPPPGSKVRLVCRWDDPLGPFPTERYRNHAASVDPYVKPLLPPGVVSIDTGGPQQTNWAGNSVWGPNIAASNTGVVWLVGDSGASQWRERVFPPEIQRVTWHELDPTVPDDEPPRFFRRYEPIYFDCRSAKTFALELTVPPHGGELGLQIRWEIPGFSVQSGGAGEDIHEPLPIRTYPGGLGYPPSEPWATYPKPTRPVRVEFPQGNLHVGDPQQGRVPTQRLVVGQLADAIPLINPNAEGWEITVE